MKNIHVIPTDRPSYLYKMSDGSLNISDLFEGGNSAWKNQHIDITSDEQIKEGDWCLDKFNQRWKLEDKKLIAFDSRGIKRFSTDNIAGHECKKIILTTDQDLINDGVQDIDDEFLEWFVKNPSCESLETKLVEFEVDMGLGDSCIEYGSYYKIIIPKEEPKLQCKDCNDNLTDCTCIEDTIDMKEEYTNSQQKSLELNKKFVKETDNETLNEIMSQFDVPKQETIEEAELECLKKLIEIVKNK